MMTIEEVLKTQGLTPEQIAGVMKGMQDNHIQLLTPEQEKQIKEYEALVPEHKQLKEDYDASVKAADKTKGELAKLHVDVQVKDALRTAKVKDMDYAMFKLTQAGELKLGEDGKVVDLEARVKNLIESTPNNFTEKQQKTVVERKPGIFDAAASVTEPHNLNEALQEAYAKSE